MKCAVQEKKKVFRDFPKCGGLFLNPMPGLAPAPGFLSHVQPLPLVLPLGPATGELT